MSDYGDRPRRWDCWPLLRLCCVGLAFAGVWGAPPFSALAEAGGRFALYFLVLAVVSITAARLVLCAVVLPLTAVVVLNDWLYDACRRLLRALHMRNPAGTAALALAGEIGAFLLIADLIARAARALS